ncbi:MAG TPA: N-formylglutamate amidohydrolase, partial [Fimbriimonas sp.]|nr:N-formylglutamate amidohydrolase [Fimbriimonas sp.]
MLSAIALMFCKVTSPDLAIVICAPHGGGNTIPGVAERSKKDTPQFTTVTDTRTDKLAHAIAEQITKQTRKVPFLVVATVSRKYVDLNRDPKTAYEDERAKSSYDAYHAAIASAVDAARKLSPNAILLDIHGQGRTAATIYRGTQNGATVKGFATQSTFFQQLCEIEGLNIEPPLSADADTK